MSSGEASRYHPIVRHVNRALRLCMRGRRGHVLLAVSGGGDSMAMLRAMAVLANTRRWSLQLTVGHVQHHLRDDAEADAVFVEQQSRALSFPFLRLDIDPAGTGENIEAAARRMRYGALQTMADQCGANFVATAHHGEDQLETLLMAMLRGSGVAGMRGIAPRRRICRDSQIMLIRPLLGLTREGLQSYLQSLDQPWREDHTNVDTSRLRARIRAQVVPSLLAIREDAPRRAGKLTTHMRQAQQLIERTLDEAMQHVTRDSHGAMVIGRLAAREMDPLVLGGVLRRLLCDAGVDKDRLRRQVLGPVVRAARDRAGGQREFDLPGGAKVSITRDALVVTVDQPAADDLARDGDTA